MVLNEIKIDHEIIRAFDGNLINIIKGYIELNFSGKGLNFSCDSSYLPKELKEELMQVLDKIEANISKRIGC